MRMKRILVINGPNLDMLGTREPEIYGSDTLEVLEEEVSQYGSRRGISVECFQSNSEGALIDRLHAAPKDFDGIVYNPGAHTHYSYALRDAVGSIDTPVVEVHLSDISDREPFRRVSVIAPVCIAQVKGLGIEGYCRAIDILRTCKAQTQLGDAPAVAPASGELAAAGERDSTAMPSEGPAHREPASSADSLVVFSATREVEAVPEEKGDSTVAEARSRAPEVGCSPVLDEPPVDYAAAYAGAVASVDAGLLSFERQSAVREACRRIGIASILIRDTSNAYWVSALDGVFDEERAHALLMTDDRAYLHTDSRYANAIKSRASLIGSDVIVNDERVSHPQFAYNVLTRGDTVPLSGKLGIEDTITYAEFVKMVERFTTSSLSPTSEVVRGLRAVKDAGEIVRLKAAQAITDAAFSHIVGFMRPGMTEREVQLELEDFMVRHGAQGLAFRSIVATGPNGADPHAVPGNTRLEAGQCVVMDFGAKAYGYCSDMTRTVFLGRPAGAMAEAWDALRHANEAVEAMLKPGVTGAEAHEAAERALEEGGFGGRMGHGLGHGVGIDVHELPMLNPRNETPLVAGNVVTVEPGIYLPGKFGMRLEDFGVVTDEGFEVFTQSTHEMVII